MDNDIARRRHADWRDCERRRAAIVKALDGVALDRGSVESSLGKKDAIKYAILKARELKEIIDGRSAHESRRGF